MTWCRRPRMLSMVSTDDRNCRNSVIESAVQLRTAGVAGCRIWSALAEWRVLAACVEVSHPALTYAAGAAFVGCATSPQPASYAIPASIQMPSSAWVREVLQNPPHLRVASAAVQFDSDVPNCQFKSAVRR